MDSQEYVKVKSPDFAISNPPLRLIFIELNLLFANVCLVGMLCNSTSIILYYYVTFNFVGFVFRACQSYRDVNTRNQ